MHREGKRKRERERKKTSAVSKNDLLKVPLWWLPLLRSMQITTIAIIITTMAHITGTTRFIFDRMMRKVSSAVRSGISREGAIVPVTTTIYKERTKKPVLCLFFFFFIWKCSATKRIIFWRCKKEIGFVFFLFKFWIWWR